MVRIRVETHSILITVLPLSGKGCCSDYLLRVSRCSSNLQMSCAFWALDECVVSYAVGAWQSILGSSEEGWARNVPARAILLQSLHLLLAVLEVVELVIHVTGT